MVAGCFQKANVIISQPQIELSYDIWSTSTSRCS